MNGILLLVISLIGSLRSAPKAGQQLLWDIPAGHCDPICSCQMDRLYYSEGEQWAKPEDPCTVFRCSKNGSIETVKKGCRYGETCHSVGSTWTDDCNNFTCTENSNFTTYKLTEAGCPVSNGGCRKVGERWHEGCDLLECQLGGLFLKTKKIRTGCAVEGKCKKIDSYWHDGCTIYTCAKQSNVAVKQTLKNEVMQWPEGNYALYKPLTGCPGDVSREWTEGSRTHYSAGRNFFSKPLSVAGNYTEEYMRHEFCIHGTSTSSARLPRYKTYWEPGSYCILRRGGICPRGFSNGYVAFDDNDSRSKSVSTGSLPDGDFTTKTGLHFCCRKDGSIQTEIVLPKDESFVLFMEEEQTKCQAVKGMIHSVEFISFDGLLTSKHEKRGHTPSVKISEGDVTISFCHYKPRECGCLDGSGQTIHVNTEKEINCVIKKCVSENGKNVIKVVSEGCKDGDVCKKPGEEIYRNCVTSRCTRDTASKITALKVVKAECPWLGTCKAPNSTWTYNCMTYRCDMNTDHGHYQWNVQPVKYGCSDGKGNCYKVGENVSGECFDAICQLSENKTEVFLDVTKAGCTWKDRCKAVNDTWIDGCHRFKCEWIDTNVGFTAMVNATDVSCEWNYTCYKEDEVWSDGCIDYKCIASRLAGTVNWSVKAVSLACKDLKGKCIPVGKEFVQDCITYKCKQKGNRIGLDPISAGCKWNNTCYSENEIWNATVKCIKYQCLKLNGPTGAEMQVSVEASGCVFNNTCMAVNSTWADGCRTRKCIVHKTDGMLQRSIAAIAAECDDEGICRKVGYKKNVTSRCLQYQCIFNDTYKQAFFSLTRGACRSTDGKCHNVGTKWTEKRQNTCLHYECRKEQIGYLSSTTQQRGPHNLTVPRLVTDTHVHLSRACKCYRNFKRTIWILMRPCGCAECLDAKGNCQAVGASGFQANVKGKLRKNCSCVRSTTNKAAIGIQCKG